MEIVPGIHRHELYLGKKLIALHLILGRRAVLIDAATVELMRDGALPWLRDALPADHQLDAVLITHADVDHYGGLADLCAAYPRAMVIGPSGDKSWIENPDRIFAERYDAYHLEHGLTYTAELTATLHSWIGAPVPLDIALGGDDVLDCGDGLVFQVIHVPGHTPGHLMLWEPQRRVALIGDALNGATQIDREGAWTAPPPYTDRDLQLASIETLRALQPAILLTAHYPVMTGDEITQFMDATRDFIYRADDVVRGIFQSAGAPVTLGQLIEQTDLLLGPFLFSPDLQFAIEAHARWLEDHGEIRRAGTDLPIAWEVRS